MLLTIILLMRALDPLKYEKETMEYLDKLLLVDEMRTNYYKDLSESISCITISLISMSLPLKILKMDRRNWVHHYTIYKYVWLGQGWTVSSTWWKKPEKTMEKTGLEEIVSSGQKRKKLEETTFGRQKLF